MIVVHKQPLMKARKAGPTPLFWGAIVILAVLIVAVVAITSAQKARDEASLLAEQPVNEAVEYALTVARQTAAALGTESDVEAVRKAAEEIRADKDIQSRVERMQELIGEMLSLAQGSQSAIDELNGAKNRVHIAIRNYVNLESGGS